MLPSAIITDGLLPVPLFAVNRISLSEKYSLPAIGSSGFRAAVENSDDTVSIGAMLVGPQRFAWKSALELLAETSRRGGMLGRVFGGTLGPGLALITSLTLRTNMQVMELSFTSSAARRDALEVSISMKHVPRPGPLNLLMDVGASAAMSVVDWIV